MIFLIISLIHLIIPCVRLHLKIFKTLKNDLVNSRLREACIKYNQRCYYGPSILISNISTVDTHRSAVIYYTKTQLKCVYLYY